MSGFKGLALVNSKKKYGSGVNGISKFDSGEPEELPVKVPGKTLAGRTAGVERGQSRVCQILFIFSDQELEAYTAQSLAPGPHH